MRKYLSLIKFSHSIFAMPFALIGFFLATELYGFDWVILIYIILCMIFARSAAMAFNGYIDRDSDKKNPRTSKIREIPTGEIKKDSALIFVIINSLFFLTTTFFINQTCFYLAPIALFLILGYSYTKRFTALCHIILGISLSLSPIGAYLAVSNTFDITPIFFSLVVIFWVSGFDIIYSLQDQEFDKKEKLHSIPVLFGVKKSLIISRLFHIVSISILYYIAIKENYNNYYWIGFSIFSIIIIYQHMLVKYNDLSKVNIAFFTTNGTASIIFGIFVIMEIILN